MSNSFDYLCPYCGSGDQLDIAATVWVRLTSDGTDCDASEDGGHEWGDDNSCICQGCGWQGFVKNLVKGNENE
jgi:hypothetical protein